MLIPWLCYRVDQGVFMFANLRLGELIPELPNSEDRYATIYRYQQEPESDRGFGITPEAIEANPECIFLDALFPIEIDPTYLKHFKTFRKAYKHSKYFNEYIPELMSKEWLKKVCLDTYYRMRTDFDSIHAFVGTNELSDFYLHSVKVQLILQQLRKYAVRLDDKTIEGYVEQKLTIPGVLGKKENNLRSDYNFWGAISGRLSHFPHSFPILNLRKDLRSCIIPHNDYFVDFDYRAADITPIIYMCYPGIDFDSIDLYDWVCKLIDLHEPDRNKMKQKVFASVYANQVSELHKKMRVEDKISQFIIRRTNTETWLLTPYSRILRIPNKENQIQLLPYIIQSVTNDSMLSTVVKVQELINANNLKSKICFLIHDEFVMDVVESELEWMNQIGEIMKETRIGRYSLHTKIGKNFGDMKEIS
jgi:hypothetical protein